MQIDFIYRITKRKDCISCSPAVKNYVSNFMIFSYQRTVQVPSTEAGGCHGDQLISLPLIQLSYWIFRDTPRKWHTVWR